MLNIDPEFETYTGSDPVGFVLSLNLHRRHLTSQEKHNVIVKIEGFQQGTNRYSKVDGSNDPSMTAAEVGKKLGVGSATVKRVRKRGRDLTKGIVKIEGFKRGDNQDSKEGMTNVTSSKIGTQRRVGQMTHPQRSNPPFGGLNLAKEEAPNGASRSQWQENNQ
jgi:hypothetical protein